jgi:hypothetical protein
MWAALRKYDRQPDSIVESGDPPGSLTDEGGLVTAT